MTPHGLEEIRNTLAKISQDETLMDQLCEFERTLDKTGIYAYQNWLEGELIDGPHSERFWFRTAWLYKHTDMPDPDGALRLSKIGCKVWYEETVLKQPIKVTSPEDWRNNQNKRAKLEDVPAWIVHINMPIKYITSGNDEIHGLVSDEVNYEVASGGDSSEDPMGGGIDDFGGEEDKI
jgi:hypothetical protein